MTTPSLRFLDKGAIRIALLILLPALIYSNTFHVPFLFDDEASIQFNPLVHGLASYFRGGEGYHFLPNRAFGYLTFALNYQLGGLNTGGYHAVNLAIHIATTLLVYRLVRLTVTTPRLNGSFSESGSSRFSLVVAIFFACHPVQTQAVTYIVQRLTSLAAMLYVASLVCYLTWRLRQSGPGEERTGGTGGWYAGALVAALLAMKTKEITFTLPVIILLTECLLFGRPGRRLLARMTPLLLTIATIPATLFFTVGPLIPAGGTLLSDVTTPVYDAVRVTPREYLYTQFSVIVTYLRLLLLPVNQNLDYDFPLNRALFAPRTLLSLALLLALLAAALWALVRSTRVTSLAGRASDGDTPGRSEATLYRLAAFGIFWFFVTLAVESSFITIQDVIFEHRLYLPSIGFFLTVTSLGTLGLRRLEGGPAWLRPAAVATVALVISLLSAATYARNEVWRDWITLWSDTVAKSPGKARPRNILGIGYYYASRMDEAMANYQDAVRIRPDFVEAHYNMGLIHELKKEYPQAIAMLQKALAISSFDAELFAKLHNEIGLCYAEMGEHEKAVTSFAEAVKYTPESIEFRTNYAYALVLRGNKDAAVREYRTILDREPGNTRAKEMLREMTAAQAGGAEK